MFFQRAPHLAPAGRQALVWRVSTRAQLGRAMVPVEDKVVFLPLGMAATIMNLTDLRRQVDALTAKPAESFAHYTTAISAGVDVIGAVAAHDVVDELLHADDTGAVLLEAFWLRSRLA